MQHYHPIRIALVERLEAQRKEANVAALQAAMLASLSMKSTSVRTLKTDRSFVERQRTEEGFDAESSAPWRLSMIDELSKARAGFAEVGKNIFDVSRLCPLFRDVDVDDVVLEDTPLPYESLFLHFGSSAQLTFAPDLWIDGAYVRGGEDGDGQIVLTFVCNHPGWKATADIPLGQTFKRNSTAACLHISRSHSVAWAIEHRPFSGAPEMLNSTNTLVEALRMAVNGLLYLNLAKADLDYGFPPEAPKELVFSAINGTGDKKGNAVRKLDALGYVRVNFVGRNMVTYVSPSSDDHGSKKHRAPHWRRGHWRRVAVGEGRKGREWRLFQGTVVNGASGPPAEKGRIHIVKPSQAEGSAR